MTRRKLVYKGQTKTLYEGTSSDTSILHFRDEATTREGKPAVFEGKGVLNNRLSEHLLKSLNVVGVPTHLVRRMNMREQLVRTAEILPLRIVVRNFAAGSIAKRFGLAEGDPLPRPIIEFYLKNAKLGHPLVTEDQAVAFGWASPHDMEDILPLALRANDFLTGMMMGVGIRLVDFSFEVGRIWEEDFQRLVIVDEVSPDVCRLWDMETGRKLDKDVLRMGLGHLTEAYTEVAERLGVLPRNDLRTIRPALVN